MGSAVSVAQCIAEQNEGQTLSFGQALALVLLCGVIVWIGVLFDRRMDEAERRCARGCWRDDSDGGTP